MNDQAAVSRRPIMPQLFTSDTEYQNFLKSNGCNNSQVNVHPQGKAFVRGVKTTASQGSLDKGRYKNSQMSVNSQGKATSHSRSHGKELHCRTSAQIAVSVIDSLENAIVMTASELQGFLDKEHRQNNQENVYSQGKAFAREVTTRVQSFKVTSTPITIRRPIAEEIQRKSVRINYPQQSAFCAKNSTTTITYLTADRKISTRRITVV